MARKERYEYACSRCSDNCWGCFYAEECPVWNDQQDAEPTQIPVTEVYMSLCEGRHEIPQAIDGSIFAERNLIRSISPEWKEKQQNSSAAFLH